MNWLRKILTALRHRNRQQAEAEAQSRLAAVVAEVDRLYVENQGLKIQLTTTADSLINALSEAKHHKRRAEQLQRDLYQERRFVTQMRNEQRQRFQKARR